jgi:DNA modification methylase
MFFMFNSLLHRVGGYVLQTYPSATSSTNSPQYPLGQEDWSFAHLTPAHTLWGPHGYHRYPAKFIPQLVRRIIDEYSHPYDRIGDPFLGSATTGIEALRAGRSFYGSDIHPVALLISKAKCLPLEPQYVNYTWSNMMQALSALPLLERSFLTKEDIEYITQLPIARATPEERLNYWFPLRQRNSLAHILDIVCALKDENIRVFFLCAFSNILRRCSIWLSGSTKPQKDIRKMLCDPVEEFRGQIQSMINRNSLYWKDLQKNSLPPIATESRLHLVQEDVRHLSLANETLDLLVTSPPYATCYEYSEMHQLTQLWFEKYHIFQNSTLDYIGTKTLARKRIAGEQKITSTGSLSADKALQQLYKVADKAKKNGQSTSGDIRQEARALHYYFHDMHKALAECARIVASHKYMVLIVGNSFKRGVCIPTSEALCEMAECIGFRVEKRIVRRIPGRVLVPTRDKQTGRFSSVKSSDTTVYPEEHILIFQRCF